MTDAARRDYSWSFPNRRFIDGGSISPPFARRASTRSPSSSTPRALSRPRRSRTSGPRCARSRPRSSPRASSSYRSMPRFRTRPSTRPSICPTRSSSRARGGTDFRPGFTWLDEQGIRPGVCIYLTDMLCSSYPDTEPHFPVIWANYSEPPGDWNREPWGERIDIADI